MFDKHHCTSSSVIFGVDAFDFVFAIVDNKRYAKSKRVLLFEQSKITFQTIKYYFLSNAALRVITYCFPVQFISYGPLQLD